MFPKNQNPGCEPELIRFFSNLAFGNQARWLLILSFFFLNGRLIVQAQDTTPPSATISGSATHSNSANFDFNIIFSEAVNGFVQSDLTISNGTINSLGAGVTTYTHALTLGTTGMAGATNSLLDGPTSIAVDANGNILVVDRTNHRIQVYNSAGVYQSTIGTASPVADNTGFNSPWGIALDSQGNLYVSDQANHRIQIFNSSYVYQSTIGTGAIVADNTGFNNPSDIHVDASGNIYVSDRGNHRVQIFDNTQTYVATIGTGAAVSDNTGFNAPHGLTTDASGNLYVTDRSNGRVQVFGPGPTYTYSNTISGLVFPLGVDIDGNGNLYIAEALTHRLRVFDNTLTQTGSVVTGTNSGSTNTDLNTPSDVTVDVNGRIYVADSGNERVQVFSTTETYTTSVTATTEGLVTLTLPAMVATDAAGNQNTTAEGSFTYDTTAPIPTITNNSGDLTNDDPVTLTINFPETVNDFFLPDVGVTNGSVTNFLLPSELYSHNRTLANLTDLDSPDEVFIGNNGNIYVFTGGDQQVLIYNTSGTLLSTVASNNIDSPEGVAQDASGNFYVAESSNSEITIFNEAGVYQSSFTSNELSNPTGVALDNAGNIYVTDNSESAVIVYNSSMVFTGRLGENELSSPDDIFIDDTNTIYVLEGRNDAIYVYNTAGVLQNTINLNPPAGFFNYQNFTVNSSGNFILVDNSPQLSVYNTNGLIGTFRGAELAVSNIQGATLDNAGNLYVTDYTVNEIEVYDAPTTGYIASVSPGMDGTVTIDLLNGAAQDLAGNASTAAQLSFTFDQTAPSVTLTTMEPSPSNSASFSITAQFSEEVSGFSQNNFTVQNASVSNFTMVNASTYTATVNPLIDGIVTVDIIAGVVSDLAGNTNTASNQLSIISDRFIPEASLISRAGIATNTSPFEVIATFSEATTGFDVNDIVVNNATLSNFTANNTDYLYFSTIGGNGQGHGNNQFDTPTNVTLDAAGNIYVADQINHRIQIFDSNMAYVATIGTTNQSRTDNLGFGFPVDVAIDASGNIYVTDTQNQRVQVFDANREYLTTMGTSGMAQTDNTGFTTPLYVSIDALGRIYVADAGNQRVQVFDANRNYLATIGTTGQAQTDNTGFNGPRDIDFDSSGNIYIVDNINGRVQVYDSNRNYLSTIGDNNGGNSDFLFPTGVTVDQQGNVLVADAVNDRVQVFDTNYNYVATIGTSGQAQANNTGFDNPGGIAIDANGRTFITDVFNHRVQVYQAPMDAYIFSVTPLAEGNISLDIPAGVATDNNSNSSTAATQLNVTYDITGPVASFQGPTAIANDDPFSLTINFDEAVNDFTLIDIDQSSANLLNASISNFTMVNSTTFTMDVTPDGSLNDLTLRIISGTLSDDLGNNNLSIETTINYDVLGPVLEIQNAPISIGGTTPFAVTFQFNETVLDFTQADVTVVNGALSNFNAVDGDTYTATVTPDGNGNITLFLPANRVTDVFSLPNLQSFPVTTLLDNLSPTMTMSTAQNPIANTTFDVAMTFSEEVSGFDQGDIMVTNGSVNTLTAPSGDYTFQSSVGTGAFGTGNNEFAGAKDIAIDNSGNIFVVDAFNNRVQVFDSNNNYIATIGGGTIGSGNNEFNTPSGIFIDQNGLIYVADTGNNRIQVFDTNRNYFNTIGSTGSALGQLTGPVDVFVDLLGNVYVLESTNTRVQVFDNNFNALRFFGSFGLGDGEFVTPSSIHVDLSGRIFVADRSANNNSKVHIFNNDGSFISALGLGPLGNDNNSFSRPEGVFVSNSGLIYVADTRNSRIQVFDVNFNYLRTIGSQGTGNGQFSRPVAAILDSNGNLYVLEDFGYRFQILNAPIEMYTASITANGSGIVNISVPSGSYSDQVGNASTSASDLDVEVDITGPAPNISSLAGTIVNAAFETTIQFDEAATGFDITDIVAVNGTLSNFMAVDADTYTLTVTPTTTGQVTLNIASGAATDALGNNSSAATQFSRTFNPNAITATLSTMEASPSNNSTFSVSLNFDRRTNASNTSFVLTNATAGNIMEQSLSYAYSRTINHVNISSPFGVAVNADGLTFVSGNNRVEIFDATGTLVDGIGLGTSGSLNGQFNDIRDIALDASGQVYIIDRVNHRIQVFNDGSFSFQQAFGSRGSGDTQFEFPSGIAIAPNGNIVVADENNERVQIFDSNFNYIATLGTTGTQGSTNALFRRPEDVFVDGNGRIYVADTGNDRIQIYNADLSFFGTIGTGSSGSGNDAFNNPTSVFVDAFGDIYVTDLTNHRVQIFGNNLAYRTTLGTGSTGTGNDAFDNPTWVAISPAANAIYITDQSNNRTQVFNISVSDITADITPTAEGTVQVSYASNQVTDAFANPNSDSNILEVIHDLTSPTVDIQNEPTVINNTAYTVTFEFSEAVTGFDLTDITSVNASASNFTVVDANTYTALITPNGSGDMTIDVNANTCTDLAGNANLAASQAMILHDIVPPDVTISSATMTATNTLFSATFAFSEAVTGFDLSDITASNGSLSNLSGSGSTYTVTISPLTEGQVTLDLNAGIATDAAGNGNNAASQFSIAYDITPPTVSLTHNIPAISNATLESVTAVFSETVNGFTMDDITVTNGTVPFFSGNLFQISPTSEGTVSFLVAAGTVTDVAGNFNTASNQVSFESDQTGPTISFMNVPIVVNAAGPFTITIEFNEAAGPVTVNDFQVTNGTANQVTGSGTTFSLEVTPDGQGDITVQSLNTLTDAAGNAVTNMVQETVTLDITPPDVTITSAAGTATNFNPLRITLTFTEPVTGLDLADLVLTNATASNLLGSGTIFTVDVSPVAEGNMTVDLAANAVVDAANNGNNAAPQFTVTYDNTEPTVTLSTSVGTITNANPATVNLDFNESITGLELTDLMLTNATASNLAGSGASYTVDITPTAEGSVTVDLPALTVTDLAGNGNALSNTVSFSYDMTAPTATISTMEASPTNQNSFLAQFLFSEDVTGFDMSDITVGNGTLSNFMGSGDAYSATITASADGAVLVDIASNAATDMAGNGNTAATQLAVIVDQTGPAITINAPATVGNNAFTVTFTFNEAVADFTLADVVVSNATTSNFMGSGTSYSLDLTPTSTNIITIDVAAGAATDALGNLSSAAPQAQVTSDLTAPDLVISSTASSPTNLTSIPVTFTFSENVTGFDLADITVSNASASNLTGSGMTYTTDITPHADGNITIDVAAGAATDEAGNGNNAATQFSLLSDLTPPTVSISTSITGPTSASSIAVTITFSEAVTGFDITDLTAGNGSVSNFMATSATVYTADLSPTADGTLSLDIAASSAADGAGNGNSAATQFSIITDQTAPTISISSSLNSLTNAGTIPLSITFSEDVTGFDVSDLSVSNATAANFMATSAFVYSVELTPTADGTITVDINGGVASDAAGNGNTAAAQFSITSDRTAPIITLSTTASDPTNLSSIPLTLTFSEDVSGFAIFDLVAGNASVNGFSMVSASSYLVNLAPIADGTLTLDIAGSVATDAAGNGNNAITQFSLVSDRTGPVVTILNAPALTGQAPFSLSFTFNEAVADFIESDISVANGTVSNFIGSGTSYSADITPDGNGDVTVSIAAGTVTDGSGNTNATIASETILTDFTAPSITISTPESSPSNASTFSATFTFSEMVSGFALGDITVVNGTASNLMASSATVYTADISPTNDGDVAITVTAASAIDAVGNNNSASNTLTITSDRTTPEVTTITRVDSNPLMGDMAQFAVSFSESVMGIESTDFSLIVTGSATGMVSNVSASTGNQVTVTVDNIGGGGTLGLNITDLTSMSDAAGNNLSAVATSEVYDVNVAPTDITISNSSIQENNVVGDLIGSLSTIDADVNDQHSYSIVSGTGDTDNAAFTIDGANGLRAAVVFDFEVQTSYSLRIQTDDGRGGTFAKALTIDITNEAEPEISITGAPLTFSATGPTPIGLNEQLSFQIVNNGDADLIINSITYPDAVFSGNFNSGTIAAQGSQTVTVTFAPTAPQTYSGNITIDANAGTELVSISGLGAFVTDIPDIPDLDGKLNVYPNPANKMLTIDLKDLIQWEPGVSIFNSQGLMVFELKEVTDDRLSIDVSNYAQGIFLINIVTTKGIIQHKVMIKR